VPSQASAWVVSKDSTASRTCASRLAGLRVLMMMKPSTGAPPGLADPVIGPRPRALPPRTTLTCSMAITGMAFTMRPAIVGCSIAPSMIQRKLLSPRIVSPLKPLRLPCVAMTPVAVLSRSNTSLGRSCSISSRPMTCS
jgi:hypothetical protein